MRRTSLGKLIKFPRPKGMGRLEFETLTRKNKELLDKFERSDNANLDM